MRIWRMTDITSEETIRSALPTTQLLYLTLLLAIRDRATEVCFEPCVTDDEWKIRYRVEGTDYDLVPIQLAFPMMWAIKRLARLSPLRWAIIASTYQTSLLGLSRKPRENRFRLGVAGNSVEFAVSIRGARVDRSRILESAIFRLPEGSLPSEKAGDLIHEFMRKRRSDRERADV